MSSDLSEFALIKRYFQHLTPSSSELVAVGVGDDCAVINIPEGHQLCLSIDTMVEGVHFPPNYAPELLSHRALAAALSDLAAMGADPSHFSLALTLPKVSERWLKNFSAGLKNLAAQFCVDLVGGDTTRGPLSVSIQVHGFVPKGRMLKRSGARPGDVVAVSGALGDAGAGLSLISQNQGEESLSSGHKYLLSRYHQPSPRLGEGVLLREYASACIDISDGLISDAEHIARASACALNINVDQLPLSEALKGDFSSEAIGLALSAGDDYELLFTLSEERWEEVQRLSLAGGKESSKFTKIGFVSGGQGVQLWDEGKPVSVERKGYVHFG